MFGEIGWEVSLNSVMESLKDFKGTELTINISGPGGYVDEAFAIYSYLGQWKKDNSVKITFNIIGTCASCDSFIPMIGDEIVVNSGSRMMIHLASAGFGGGNSEELRKLANDLESYSNQIADIYLSHNKKGKTIEDIKDWMGKETYFNAQELIDFGFATKFEDIRPTAKIKTQIQNQNINMASIIDTIKKTVADILKAKNLEVKNYDGLLEDGSAVVIVPVDETKGVPVVGDMVSPALVEMKVVTIGGEKYEITSDEAGVITLVTEVEEEEMMDAKEVAKIIEDLTAKFEADNLALKNENEALKNSNAATLAEKETEIANLKQAAAPAITKKVANTKPMTAKERALAAVAIN